MSNPTYPLLPLSSPPVSKLSEAIASAVALDEAEEGCDISAGLFGKHFSQLIQELASKLTALDPSESELPRFALDPISVDSDTGIRITNDQTDAIWQMFQRTYHEDGDSCYFIPACPADLGGHDGYDVAEAYLTAMREGDKGVFSTTLDFEAGQITFTRTFETVSTDSADQKRKKIADFFAWEGFGIEPDLGVADDDGVYALRNLETGEQHEDEVPSLIQSLLIEYMVLTGDYNGQLIRQADVDFLAARGYPVHEMNLRTQG
jgi:hypothetical protein